MEGSGNSGEPAGLWSFRTLTVLFAFELGGSHQVLTFHFLCGASVRELLVAFDCVPFFLSYTLITIVCLAPVTPEWR